MMPARHSSPGKWLVEYGRPGRIPLQAQDCRRYWLTLAEAKELAANLLEEVGVWEKGTPAKEKP